MSIAVGHCLLACKNGLLEICSSGKKKKKKLLGRIDQAVQVLFTWISDNLSQGLQFGIIQLSHGHGECQPSKYGLWIQETAINIVGRASMMFFLR